MRNKTWRHRGMKKWYAKITPYKTVPTRYLPETQNELKAKYIGEFAVKNQNILGS